MVIIATLISAILIIVVVLQFKEKRRVKKERDTQRRKEQRREMIMKTVAGLSAVMMKANTVRTKSQIEIVKNYLDRKMNSTYAKQTIEYLKTYLYNDNLSVNILCLNANRTFKYSNRVQLLNMLMCISTCGKGICRSERELIEKIMRHMRINSIDKENLWTIYRGYIVNDEENLEESLNEKTKNAFKTMELNYNCSLKELKRQWRKLSMKYHPDKYELSDEYSKKEATRKMQEIVNAYYFLLNNYFESLEI